jgi:sulfite reductase (ferredoxin)
MTTTPRQSIAGSKELVALEIDSFSRSIDRFRTGRVSEAVFLEERLRLGVYGQRQDGVHMMRSKLPLGLMGAEQLEAFADVAETFGNGVAHLTTRQDIQVHFIQLEESPQVMRVLDGAEMTSREACGNVVRNVVGSPVAGVSPTEAFDITTPGIELSRFLLRHPDGMSLGRKFKIAFAGCPDPTWNLGAFHDLGFTAVLRGGERGYAVVVGGGLGAVAYEAQPYTDFLPEAELLPFSQAVLRLFALHGEKKNRARARLKFLLSEWGMDRFRSEVEDIRSSLHPDPAWTAWIERGDAYADAPLHPPGAVPAHASPALETWIRTNTTPQSQSGYRAVKIRVPQGDLGPVQLRGLAALLREHTGDTLRIGPDQSLVLRWVPSDRLAAVQQSLAHLGLDSSRAGGLGDTVTCPGADSCKLGITSPRAMGRSLESTLDRLAQDPRLERLRIHISGCPNGCAQHQVADIGFFGAARTVGGVTAPHYVLLLGGLAGGTGGETHGAAFGTTVIKIPAARLHEAIERILDLYLQEGLADANFGVFARRLGRGTFKILLQDLTELPSFEEQPEAYREPGSSVEFALKRGKGECAGAMVDQVDLLLAEADREADTAVQIHELLGDSGRRPAEGAMLLAARALLASEEIYEADPDRVESAFRERFYDNGRIFEGVGYYFLQAQAERTGELSAARVARLVVEAGLFVEEIHGLVIRLRGQAAFPRGRQAVVA